MRMKHRTILLTLALLAFGTILATSMTFKHHRELLTLNTNSGTHSIALPFIPKSGVSTAQTLMDDIGFADVINLQRYNRLTDSLEIYTGRKGSPPDFSLEAGTGYFVRMTNPVSYMMVGTHNPALAIELFAANEPESATGNQLVALPYHLVPTNSEDLMVDIGFASVANVQRHIPSNDSIDIYTGRKGTGPTFLINPGEAYFIKMNESVTYYPSHY